MTQKLLLLFFCFFSPLLATATPLGTYNVDPKEITISGVSSGAYMAVQMHVAYSQTFSGVASIAGGIYWCAKGDPQRAQTVCLSQPAQIRAQEQIQKAKELASSGAIDPLNNLRRQPIYIFASPKDAVVNPINSDKLQKFYQAFVSSSFIRTEHRVPSGHGLPTLNHGNPCDLGMIPWILKCGFDTAGELLKTLYGPLNPRGTSQPSHLLKFSQADFGNAQTPLYSQGWIYVPADCSAGKTCRLHVALHGCQMNPDFIQDKYARFSGYNEWAETNRIIVLYPQSAKLGSANPYACWDWFGFTGSNYMTKNGTQMSALKNMIDRVTGNQN